MKRTKNILLLFPFIGIMSLAPTTQAQVTATARVVLTVVPAPGMNFAPTPKQASQPFAAGQMKATERNGVVFQSTGNVMVQLNSTDARSSRFNFQQGESRTFTSNDLKNVTSVEIVYLGS